MTQKKTPKPFFPTEFLKKDRNQREEAILKHWQDQKTFEKTLKSRKVSADHAHNDFTFFDGPPFATGLPHYGHILAGTIKDVIPRYKTQQGYHVSRRFGWDCHGVPVEFQVEKEEKIGGKPGIEAMGVGKFNEMCRSIVLRCRNDWEKTVNRMGRFVDFQNDYRTMDISFMESVWWVFKTLWDKNLIYEGEKVIAYSPKLGSPLSNFEANLNYKDIDDPAVTIRFKRVKQEPKEGEKSEFEPIVEYFLAWTTTPWTLPSNMGLGFGKTLNYAKVLHENAYYWLHESQVAKYFGENAEILETKVGKDFLHAEYEPLFDYYAEKGSEKRFVCLHDDGDYISAESGTGIVHFAPSFGAEDADLCRKFGVKGVNPINKSGFFGSETPDLEGLYFRKDPEVPKSHENDANKAVIQKLKDNGSLFKREQIRHSYPHCWRTDCALMYRGIGSWFVDIQKIKPQMVEQNEETNWIPSHLKAGRFGKGLQGAPDWAISRSRYWGTPMPVWKNDETGEIHVIGSKQELEQLTNTKLDDLHRHFIDDLTWQGQNGGTFKRIPEVLDCWFESGSMPYASRGVKNAEDLAAFPPADFIAEGLDQTRCWFYNLHVLGVALTGKNIFKNVITNGIVLAEDGQKMSKSKKNYPDPNIVFQKYGADAVRWYLMNSPVVRGENMRFAERGVAEVLRSVLMPLENTYKFFSLYANIDGFTPTRITAVRHGEGEHNVAGIYSGNVENKHHLTPKGQDQVTVTAKTLKNQQIDAIIASPFVRTQETAQIIKEITGFADKIQTDARFQEPFFGKLEGQPRVGYPQRNAEPSTEKIEAILERVSFLYADISAKYNGQHVVLVGHGETVRCLKSTAQAFHNVSLMGYTSTGSAHFVFGLPTPKTSLDFWILSELQTTLAEFTVKMNAYDIEGAIRGIPAFLDALTNWYIRQNRRRFWASGLTEDKKSAYSTLHYVLKTLSQMLAPIIPFFAEELWQSLGGKGSVHESFFPGVQKDWINPELNEKINTEREIVRLSASIRAKKDIKLRQPLPKLSFALPKNTEIDLEVVKKEANVKEVEVLQSIKGIAEVQLLPNAKLLGRKYGKKIQELIKAGKTGCFEIKNGKAYVCDEVLEENEYETRYITAEGFEAEASNVGVVLLDTKITPELEREGYARDFIRAIQEQRKENKFEVTDAIHVFVKTESELVKTMISEHKTTILKEVVGKKLEFTQKTGFTVNIGAQKIEMTLEKAH